MKKIAKLSFYFFFFYSLMIDIASAQSIGLDPKKQPGGIKLTSDDPGSLLGSLIQNTITLFFTVGAIGFVIMFLWGSVSWILSGGDKEKIASARRRIVTAVIGLVLLSLTFVAMVVVGQILGIDALQYGTFRVPSLIE